MKFILSDSKGRARLQIITVVCVFIKHFDLNDIAFKPKMKMKFYLSETVVNF